MHRSYQIINKLSHTTLLILISITIITAIINTTLFSKPNLMEVISYSLTVAEIELEPTDTLFIARVIRQQLWEVHFYIGAALFLISTFLFVRYFINHRKNQTIKKSLIFNFNVLLCMAILGIILFYRKEMDIPLEVISYIRDAHWIGIFFLALSIFFHIYTMLFRKTR